MSKKTRAYLVKVGRAPGQPSKYDAEQYYGKGNVKQCPYCESWICATNRTCRYCGNDYPQDGIALFSVD